jgi:hypothetical protein
VHECKNKKVIIAWVGGMRISESREHAPLLRPLTDHCQWHRVAEPGNCKHYTLFKVLFLLSKFESLACQPERHESLRYYDSGRSQYQPTIRTH